MDRLEQIRRAEAQSHGAVYRDHGLYEPGSWLAKPVRTVMELVPLFAGRGEFRGLDLGCGVGRNAIALARACGRMDCVDILELAIEKLNGNARLYDVAERIYGIVSPIDGFEIERERYDLILAVSALEHMDSKVAFTGKLVQIRDGVRDGGVVCLIVNTGVRERDKATGRALPPQFEVELETEEFQKLMEETFPGWEVLKHTVVHQQYDIPRENGIAELETDVVTWVGRRN